MSKQFKYKENKDLKRKCEELNIVSWNVARMRIKKGWTIEDSLTLPIHTCLNRSMFQRQYKMSINEYCDKNNIKNKSLFKNRLYKGYSIEDAKIPAFEGKFKRHSFKENIYFVEYKNKTMKLTDAFNQLCNDLNISCITKNRMSGIYTKINNYNMTPQQAFDHFVTLYNKKYFKK